MYICIMCSNSDISTVTKKSLLKNCAPLREILKARMSYRKDLTRVIVAILHEDSSLYYYQGFHDIVEFLLLFSHFDVHWTYTMMKSLTRTYLRDYMQSNFDEVEKLLQCLFPLLALRAPELVSVLQIGVLRETALSNDRTKRLW